MNFLSFCLIVPLCSALAFGNPYSNLLSTIFNDYDKRARPHSADGQAAQVDIMVPLVALIEVIRAFHDCLC